KMYRYLRNLIDGSAVRHRLAAPPTQRCIRLDNGSRVELLSQSERSVRGPRVHRLRCDEVEEFNPEIWQAAQLVTRSETIGGRHIVGSVEALSTMHRPFGMMARLIDEAGASGRRVFRWCALDVIERCPPSRPCETCNLWNDCRGRAKEADG